MIVEHAEFSIESGREGEFSAVFPQARAVITQAPGCRWAELNRFIERDSVFLLLVGWDSVEAHTAFRATDLFTQWRALIGPFFAAQPEVEHFTAVSSGIVSAAE
jgi:quinol monooxygenase YgiN